MKDKVWVARANDQILGVAASEQMAKAICQNYDDAADRLNPATIALAWEQASNRALFADAIRQKPAMCGLVYSIVVFDVQGV